MSESRNDNGYGPESKARVGKSVCFYTFGTTEYSYKVNVFDKAVWQMAQSPRAIDVYIDGKWYQRTHWSTVHTDALRV